MKKLAAILLALMLCLGLAQAESADVTGTWYLNEMFSDGYAINPSVMGVDMTITLLPDGTARGSEQGAQTEGVWVMDGESVIVTLDGEDRTFMLADGCLAGNLTESIQIVLGREKAESVSVQAGAAKADAAMQDYNGSWSATVIDMDGMQLPVADMGMSMVITIADGAATIVEGTGEDAATVEGVAAVENGMLLITAGGEAESVQLQLHDDGLLSYTADLDGASITIYFEKTQAE